MMHLPKLQLPAIFVVPTGNAQADAAVPDGVGGRASIKSSRSSSAI
jgi:hypothetical protein